MNKRGAAIISLAVVLGLLPVPVRAQSGVYNWTGFYAGLHAGGAWGETKGSDTFDFPTEITQQRLHGAFGGAQFGYNYQFGRAVWGVELSGSYGQINGSGDCFIDSSFLLFPGETLNCHSRAGPGFPGAFTQNLTTQAVRLVLNYKFDEMISGGR